MAVAHSAASESHTGTTGSASQALFSWTHTQTGTPQGVLVFVTTFNSTSDFITSVTYGGVTLTRVTGGSAIDTATEPGRVDLFFSGTGLGAGNQTITVNRTNNATVLYASAATVTADTATDIKGILIEQNDQALTQENINDGSITGTNSLRYAAAYSGLASPPPAGANSTLLNNIDIGAYGAALVRETTAGQGSRPVGFSSATDDVAAVYVAVVERRIAANLGAFADIFVDANLSYTRKLTADQASYALAFKSAGLPLVASKAVFAATGSSAGLSVNRVITADAGSFAVSASSILFPFVLGGGTFTLSVFSAELKSNILQRIKDLDIAYYGQPFVQVEAKILDTNNLDIAYRSQPFVGRKPTDYALSASTSVFGLVNNAAQLVLIPNSQRPATLNIAYKGSPYLDYEARILTTENLDIAYKAAPFVGKKPTDYALFAQSRSFAFTGNAAGFAKQSNSIIAASATYSLAGISTNLNRGRTISCSSASYLVSANNVNAIANRYVTAQQQSYQVVGNQTGLRLNRKLFADTRTYLLIGNNVQLQQSVGPGSYLLSGKVVGLIVSRKITADTRAFALVGKSVQFPLFARKQNYQLTANQASLFANRKISLASTLYTFSGKNTGLLAARKIYVDVSPNNLTGRPASLFKYSVLPSESVAYQFYPLDSSLSKKRRRNVLIF